MIVGASVAAAGVSLGVASLGVVVGMHAGNPGKGREFEGFSDDEAQRVVTTARVFEGLAYSGAALAVSGAIVLTVAALRHRRQRRSVRNAQFAPTRNGVIFSMRF